MRIGAVLRLLGLIALLVAPVVARAVEPDEILPNPVLEARARAISAGLRCMVCQNESIDDSQAALAKDIRVLVRQRLVAGDTDDAIRAYLVSRYGNFILLKPPFEPQTVLLWLTPALVLVGGAAASFVAIRRRRRAPSPTDLSEIEKLRLATLLEANSTDAPGRTA